MIGSRRAVALYRAHHHDLTRLAFLLTGDMALAEDISQEAFIRAFGRWHDIRHRDAFEVYLRRTVVNLSRDQFRRRVRERSAIQELGHGATGSEEPQDLGQRDELLDALRALPQRQRTAVVFRYCEGLSERETAATLGTSVSAVKSLTNRGLTKLKELIQEEERDHVD